MMLKIDLVFKTNPVLKINPVLKGYYVISILRVFNTFFKMK